MLLSTCLWNENNVKDDLIDKEVRPQKMGYKNTDVCAQSYKDTMDYINIQLISSLVIMLLVYYYLASKSVHKVASDRLSTLQWWIQANHDQPSLGDLCSHFLKASGDQREKKGVELWPTPWESIQVFCFWVRFPGTKARYMLFSLEANRSIVWTPKIPQSSPNMSFNFHSCLSLNPRNAASAIENLPGAREHVIQASVTAHHSQISRQISLHFVVSVSSISFT